MIKYVLIFVVCLLAVLVALAIPSSWKVQQIATPAAIDSGEPNLTVSGDTVYLSWLEKKALRFANWNGSKWSTPQSIVSGVPFFVNWADFPSLLVSKEKMAAHWLQKSGQGSYAYDVMVVVSTNGGSSWSTPLKPHRDTVKNEHGFVSLIDLGADSFGAVWLDARKFKSTGEHDMSNEMSLLFARYDAGKFEPETVLDDRVCDCCQTAAATFPSGIFVAYRDRSSSEVRDISFVRYVRGKWTAPRPVHEDGWKIAACPVNGPSVAANGNQIAVAWFSGAGNRPRVYTAFSSNGGETFGKPIQIDQGNPNGRVDIEWLDGKTALVSWLETAGKGAEIRIRSVQTDGTADPFFTVADSSSARATGFPRMARSGKNILLAWTDVTNEKQQVRIVQLSR